MKRIFALLMAVAMLVSLGTVAVFSELPEGNGVTWWTEGRYGCGDPTDFSPVGDLAITWDPDASAKLDLRDGDMSDWADAGYIMYVIDASNMVSWVGDHTTAPAGWNVSAYFVADSEWLYFGFFVTDPHFAYINSGDYHSGDSFQVCIDFGGRLGKMLEETPDEVPNPKNIFYSFGCIADGAPIEIMRQESDNDGWLSEANGDGVKGAAKKTETGWSAEFALSWQQLYEDYVWKAWDDPSIYIGGDEDLPLNIGCCLYYLNVDDAETKALTWAAGSTNGITNKEGTPVVSWTAYDNGIGLYLPYEDGMNFNCEGIVMLDKNDCWPLPPDETTAAPETDPPAPETQRPTTQKPADTARPEPETKPQPVTPEETTMLSMDEELNMLLNKYGCSGTVGMGALSALLLVAAWTLICKKKD